MLLSWFFVLLSQLSCSGEKLDSGISGAGSLGVPCGPEEPWRHRAVAAVASSLAAPQIQVNISSLSPSPEIKQVTGFSESGKIDLCTFLEKQFLGIHYINILLPVLDLGWFFHEAESSDDGDCALGPALGTSQSSADPHSPVRWVTRLSFCGRGDRLSDMSRAPTQALLSYLEGQSCFSCGRCW